MVRSHTTAAAAMFDIVPPRGRGGGGKRNSLDFILQKWTVFFGPIMLLKKLCSLGALTT